MKYKDNINEKIELINNNLKKYLKIQHPNILFESMNYSVFAGGKRLRPLLMLAACEAVGGTVEKALPFACACEMIHTYSLIHDDLPAMDNDDLRRGKPTNHIVYGQGMAILAGDGLLNLAYEIMSEECLNNQNFNKVQAMFEIAKAAGCYGMVGGQTADIQATSQAHSDQLMFIITNKTAKLIKAAITAGAILGEANQSSIEILSDAGNKLGIAFQIRDDILDLTSTQEKLGKPINSDLKNNKLTYVTAFGLEKAKHDATTILTEAIDGFKKISDNLLVYIAENLLADLN